MFAALSKTSRLTQRLSSIPFSAEHLGHFGEHGAAAARDYHVAEDADGRVCRDAGEAVEPPHFMPMTRPLTGTGSRLNCAAYSAHSSSNARPAAKFVLDVLAGEEFYPLGVVVAELRDELVVL